MTDEQAIAAWMSGDQAAGELLARRYDQELRKFFCARLPEQEIEEMTQRVLLATVAQPRRFRGESSFQHYVFSVARRALADRHRKHRRNRDHALPSEFDLESPWYAPSQLLLRWQWDAHLRAALRELYVPFAEVIELHMLGYDNLEIAEALHINYNTARSRLVRAIAALREALHAHRVSPTLPELAPPELPAFQARLTRVEVEVSPAYET